MIETRYIKKAIRDFGQASRTKDPREALALICQWVDKPIQEEKKTVLFSPNTGRPVKSKWVPYETWNGELMPGSWIMPFNQASAIYRFLKEQISDYHCASFGEFIIEYLPQRFDGGGTLPECFHFKKPKKLEI